MPLQRQRDLRLVLPSASCRRNIRQSAQPTPSSRWRAWSRRSLVMKKRHCTCPRPWCDWPACRGHRGKAAIFKLALWGLLPVAVAEWLIRVLGWKEL